MGSPLDQHSTSTPLSNIPSSQNAPKQIHHLNRRTPRTNCRSKVLGIPIYILWTLLLIIILIIIIPIGVMFNRRNRKPPKSTILVPLYLYPSPGAWDPLLTAIASHPSQNFTIIINPNSGPGGPGLDANYTRDIPRLNVFPNVRTVGYVSTNYTNRDIALIEADIDTYVSWGRNTSTEGLGMRGMFLDETPSEWNVRNGSFYQGIAGFVRSGERFGGDALIIHNPGALPDPQYLTSSSCNITVVFEGSYATYKQFSSSKAISKLKKQAKVPREAMAAIVYDFPDGEEERGFSREVRKVVGSFYLTGPAVDGDVYAGFWDRFGGWVGDMGGS